MPGIAGIGAGFFVDAGFFSAGSVVVFPAGLADAFLVDVAAAFFGAAFVDFAVGFASPRMLLMSMPFIPDMLPIDCGLVAGMVFFATAGLADVFFEVTLFRTAAGVEVDFMPGMFFIAGMSAMPFFPAIPALELSDVICM